ncbi:DNA repair protein rad50 [Polyrhizophydium stewartii]|uniref:DNA repair protein rad50 n=1 Tax=Polyrhizophydium stewartii TaxID=2732419 RepID=A0ABR4ND53_9FUNG
MATLDKLLVRGVRSFAPDRTETLEFATPLTIIVGHNGAGKTTIIECLKYATTGDLPPNSRSGAFVFDPKLAHTSEVKAQVKLRFHNVRGDEVTCTRSLLVTQKATTKTQRTLDSILSIKDPRTGEVHDLSSRCAVVDEELAPHLAVSKAILEHVIFCHQEDSFWPLSEPSVLKKKFDEIFASTRYTKALVEIRDQRKTLLAKAKEHERDLFYLRANRDKSRKVNETLIETKRSVNEKAARIEELDSGEIAESLRNINNCHDRQRAADALVAKQTQMNHELEMLDRRITEMTSSLEVFEESDEQLQMLLSQYIASLNDQETERAALESKQIQFTSNLKTMSDQISTLMMRRGQLQAERDAYTAHCEERKRLVSEAIDQNGYTGFNTESLTNADVERFVRMISATIATQQRQLSEFRAETKARENGILSDIQRVQSEITSIDQLRRLNRTQIVGVLQEACLQKNHFADHSFALQDNTNAKIANIAASMNAVQVSQVNVDAAENDLRQEEAALAKARAELAASSVDGQLEAIAAKISDLERVLATKNKEVTAAYLQADTHARHKLKSGELDKKHDMRQRLIAEISTEITQLLGAEPNWDTIIPELEVLAKQKQEQLKLSETQHNQKLREMSSVEARLSQARNILQIKTAELQSKSRQISKVCATDDFETAFRSAEADVISWRDEMTTMNSTSDIYTKFVGKLKSSECCPLCSRGFPTRPQFDAFVAKLEGVLARVPQAKETATEELKVSETRLAQLSELQPVWNDCERLRHKEIPETQTQISSLDGQHAALQAVIDDMSGEIATLAVEHQGLLALRARADEVARLNSELAVLEREVGNLSRDLDAGGSVRTVTEIQREIEAVQAEIKALQTSAEALVQEKLGKQRDVQQRENRTRDARDELERLRARSKERDGLAAQIQQLRSEIAHFEAENKNLETKAHAIQPDLDQRNSLLARHRSDSGEHERELQASEAALSRSLSHIQGRQRDIDRYMSSGGDGKLAQCIRDIKALQDEHAALKISADEIVARLDDIQKKSANVQVLQRTVNDNIRLRQLQAQRREVGAGIAGLSAEIQRMDLRTLATEYNRFKEAHDRLLGERAELVGEQKQLEANLNRLEKELRTDYSDVERQFQEKLIDLQLAQKAAHDLEIYAKALDKQVAAIMTHHQQKMDEINKIIRELWTKTYRGLDIDTIEIRWDPEKENSRSYNYRVVMVKGDTELDMRGRCSAGQKVLTSIMIRLALAETFCVNCGILALDEPTTNLDRENIESLAESLSEIIQMRRQQSSFQLIVITHDEEFMQLLGSSEFADFYYRVEKLAE